MTDRLLFDDLYAKPAPGQMTERERAAIPVPGAPSEDDRKRFEAQCEVILERLRRGRMSLTELRAIAANHTARLSELRHKHGHNVKLVARDRKTGETWYELRS